LALREVPITFQTQPIATSPIALAPVPGTAGAQPGTGMTGNVPPAAEIIQATMTIKGLVFLPISEYDATQYSADYNATQQASGAAVLTMIARALKPGLEVTIDQFARADGGFDWRGNGQNPAFARFIFSDGKGGPAVEPTGDNAFPLTPETDIVPMLLNGPVIIGGGLAGAPRVTDWMLATALTPDGTGIIANDPGSGHQVILRYDTNAKTIGGITAVFDPRNGKWLGLDEGNAAQIASNTSPPITDFRMLQGFTPTHYYAVTIQ
jgi:hypothetical protein